MRPLSNPTGSNSISSTPSNSGGFTEATVGKDYYKDIIGQANTVPIIKIFSFYGIKVDPYNRRITCPFKSHKGGRETTPSFWYYPDTNSFNCFGCHKGGKGVKLVSELDRCSMGNAAVKILELFGDYIDDGNVFNSVEFAKQLDILMDFSQTIRQFYQKYLTEEAQVYMEVACQKFDELYFKHTLDAEALQSIVNQLKNYLEAYQL